MSFDIAKYMYPFLLVGAFLLYTIAHFIIFYWKKKGRNPLLVDNRRPPEPFVHDKKLREAILKKKFKESKVPENLDAIIIGSGVGGLTVAVLLSRAGKKVLVLEQHDQAGGCCHSFMVDKFEFDTGIHYIGNMDERSELKILLDQMTCGQLRWTKSDDDFDTVALGKSSEAKLFHMKSGADRYYDNLIDLFPKEKAAILKYKTLVKDATSSFIGIVMLKVLPRLIVRILLMTGLYRIFIKCYRKGYTSKSLQDVLDELTDDKKLQMVLSYMFGDYGVVPKDAPFILHAALVSHYENGAYYPVNGTSEIAFHMIQSIQKGGGSVLMQAPVASILCDANGTAIGVQVGTNKVNLHAKIIVSDAGVVNTFKTLLPENVAKASDIYPLIEKVGQSVSFITTFVGLEGTSSDLKLPAGNLWLFENEDANTPLKEYLNLKADEFETADFPLAFISFPSAKDPQWETRYPGMSSLSIITLANWEWFEEWQDEKVKHRGEAYVGLKDVIGRKMWQHCVDLYPHLDGKKIYMDVGTPITNQYYRACPRGEMYGLDQRLERFSAEVASKLRPESDIKGLYLTGQDILACGFASTISSGMLCTSQILNRNIQKDLLKLRKDILMGDSLTKTSLHKKGE